MLKMKRLVTITAGTFALALGGIATLASTAGPAKAAVASAQTATFAVANMTCATCPITVKTAMQKVPGVHSVNVSFKKKTARVVFDPLRVKPAAIAAASTGVGFPATMAR